MNKWIRLAVISAILLLALSPLTPPMPSTRAAGPWYVATTGNDANDCLTPATPCASINSAVNKAGFADGDTIKVAIGTYTGTGSEVVLLNRSATLSGGWDTSFTIQSGMSTVDGEAARRGVTVNISATVSFDRLSIQNGFLSADGGGIFNSGNLTLTNSGLLSNKVNNANGGGIRNSNGIMVLSNTLVSGNSSNWIGGGIYNEGIMTITNSTISNNNANGGGGGAIFEAYNSSLTLNSSTINNNNGRGYFGGSGILALGKVVINNSTISNNSGGDGSGIHNQIGYVFISNSTIADNAGYGLYSSSLAYIQNSIFAGNGSTDCFNDGGKIISLGYNLINTNFSCTLTDSDRLESSLLLGSLENNGGSTATHPLRVGSPAINAGNPGGCTDILGNPLNSDQRGMPRVGRCDIGSFEYQGIINYAFMPLVNNYLTPTPTPPPLSIYGTVTTNNVTSPGVFLELRFYDGSSWSTISTTSTGADGSYIFSAPPLAAGQEYYVRFLNGTSDGLLSFWGTRALVYPISSTSIHIGDFDIANIHLQSPYPGESVFLPRDFVWGQRLFVPSDSYEWDLFDPDYPALYWYTPPLGYVNSYRVSTLPAGFTSSNSIFYGWYVGVFSPDGGYGTSYYYRRVAFLPAGFGSQRLAPSKPRSIPEFPNGRRLPTLQRNR